MKIYSIISSGSIFFPALSETISIDPYQSVISGIEMMTKLNVIVLPIVDRRLCIGVVYLKDLIWFLTVSNENQDLLFHRFNSTISDAIHILHEE